MKARGLIFTNRKRMRKIVSVFILLVLLLSCVSLDKAIGVSEYYGEDIIYTVRPLGGRSEYKDLGMVEYNGKKVWLVTFRTHLFGFSDTEKIYSDPETFLLLRVEREIVRFKRIKIIEEYDQKNFMVAIKKFKKNKKISEQTVKSDGPLHNGITLPFYVRNTPKLGIGWRMNVSIPNKFEVVLTSIDKIKIFGKEFEAYHFISNPDKFEI